MGKIYVATDFHGVYDLWEQIKNYMQPDDKLYYLGDVADRGYCGIMILKEMMADPRVQYVIGNHDEFLMTYFEEHFGMRNEECMRGNSIEGLWFSNGGHATKIELDCDCTEDDKKAIYHYLKSAPYRLELDHNGNHFVFTHSGFTPWDRSFATLDNRVIKDNYVWNRDHFSDEWLPLWNGIDFSNWIEIHGHTPAQLLKTVTNKYTGLPVTVFDRHINIPDTSTPVDTDVIKRYANGHKIDLDLCSIISNKAALFDIDTMKATYFEWEGYPEEVD